MSPGHPFPVIPALTLSVAVALQDERHRSAPLRLPPAAVRPAPLRRAAGGRRTWCRSRTSCVANLGAAVSRPHHRGGRLVPGDPEGRPRAGGGRGRATCFRRSRRSSTSGRQSGRSPGAAAGHVRPPARACWSQELRFGGAHGAAASVADLVIHETAGLMAPGGLRELTGLAGAGRALPAVRGRATRSTRYRACGTRSARATGSSIIPTTTSPPPCSASSRRPRRIRRWWPSR